MRRRRALRVVWAATLAQVADESIKTMHEVI
jgi:hypothetical protein